MQEIKDMPVTKISTIRYVVLYIVMSVIICVLGSVHPIFFVCYQITTGLIVTGVAAKAFDKIRVFGVACCLSLGISAIEEYICYYNTKRYQIRLRCMTPMEYHEAYHVA